MRNRGTAQETRRVRDFEAFVAGAGGRLLHTATLLTAETPDDNPRARRLLTHALAHTYARQANAAAADPKQRAALLIRRAQVLETRLSDPEGAIAQE